MTVPVRRLKFVLAAGLAAVSAASLGQSQAPPVALETHAIDPGKVYWVKGGGGNSGIIIGDDGVILIDAKITPQAGAALIAEVAKLTDKPVTHVILTHSDGDHINGLAGMPDGLTIVAHEANKAEWLSTYLLAAVEVDGGRCLPPANRVPNSIVIADRVETTIDGVPLVIHHYGPAHTGGDLVIEIPGERVAFVGDIITGSVLVHPEKTGRFSGWFHTAKALLGLDVDSYVGGHADAPDTKDTLRQRIAGYRETRDRVDALVDAGHSLDEVKDAMGVPAEPRSGCRGIPYPSLPEVQFNERYDRDHELK